MNKRSSAIFLILLLSGCIHAAEASDSLLETANADHNVTAAEAQGWEWDLDRFQKYWSRKVLLFSSNLDQKLFGTEEENSTKNPVDPLQRLDLDTKELKTYETSGWLDDFFKNETYLDTTNRSYVRLRGGYEIDERAGPSLFHNLNVRIRLPKTEGRLQLYIGEDKQENIHLSHLPATPKTEGVGLKYDLPSLAKRLHAAASVGFSGIDNPYAKARIEYPLFWGSWLVKPSQNVKFSAENEFEEWTNLFFDRKLSENSILRLLLQRSTKSAENGMGYFTQLSYMNTVEHGIGFTPYLALSGRTQERSSLYDNASPGRAGVYDYSAGVIWRQKLLRDYLFYQIQPIFSFHEQYDYKPNAIIRLGFDLYFGNIK